MDFGFGDDVDRFRHEVRHQLSIQMSAVRSQGRTDPTDLTGLPQETERRILRWAGDKGWLALSLPARYGGGGRPPLWQAAFNLEAARLDAPLVDTAVTLVAHPLLTFGNERQRQELLPAITRGELIFCIAYTEEAAGSDLAAVTSRAEPDGSGFVLSGAKAHVTGAHKADWCCTVARTRHDVPARQGLSMFLVPMDSPGVTVIRRPTMNGWTLDEIRFDGVALGPDALLGALHGGWGQLLSAVGTEGGGMFHVGFAHHALEALARSLTDRSATTLEVYGRLCVELAAAERLAKRAAWTAQQTGATAAMAKIYATELLQRIARAAPELSAEGTVVRPLFAGQTGRLGWEYLERVHGTIGAGTNEMKRSVVAHHPPTDGG